MSKEETPYEKLLKKRIAYNFPEREKERKEQEKTTNPKKSEIEKEAAVQPAEKQYYKVEVEGWARTTFKYKILAESPEEALDMINKPQPLLEQPRPKPQGLKKISAKVFLFGTNMLKHMQNF